MKKSLGTQGLLFPNPVLVVGTYDKHGEPNAITLAWGGVASSGPEAISIAVRPSRYSFEAILRAGAFTVNLPSIEQAAAADFFGISSGRQTRKFEVTGLTPVRGEFVDAPYIAEFPYNIECRLVGSLDLGAHTLFVGEVKDVKASEDLLDAHGALDWEKAAIITFDSAQRVYRAPGQEVGKAFSIGRRFIAADGA
ncbi:MAG: flavin reductase family protein [Coriobacteriales bacterium]|jgi:flavin reductase (DIM6/NTAB) family NADH-FMN oxidoreductase RutF|nr:flavin reductase family protein [Coriobacteriales bacterium]